MRYEREGIEAVVAAANIESHLRRETGAHGFLRFGVDALDM